MSTPRAVRHDRTHDHDDRKHGTMNEQATTGLTPATVPSRDFWGMTPFRFGIPAGWSARPTTQHLVYFERDGDPATNCAITWKRVGASMELPRLATMNMAALKHQVSTIEVAYSKFGKLNGRMAYSRVAKLTLPASDGAEPTVVGQTYTAFFGPVVGTDHPIELFEITGHFPHDDAAEPMAALEQIVVSFEFNAVVVGAADEPDAAAKGA